jgi:predicted enzyme related to lactoylglutathione lyase
MSRAVISMSAVIYANNLERLVAFYRGVLDLTLVEAAEGDFVHLASSTGEMELSVVAIPRNAVDDPAPDDPAGAREDASVKLSFAVHDIEIAGPRVTGLGGVLQPEASRWVWRGMVHCNGHDPEGNVFELRAAVR